MDIGFNCVFFFSMSEAEAERRLKLIAAGREDVDVRCLGQGRPFAIEVKIIYLFLITALSFVAFIANISIKYLSFLFVFLVIYARCSCAAS